jgi:hypothetical protein
MGKTGPSETDEIFCGVITVAGDALGRVSNAIRIVDLEGPLASGEDRMLVAPAQAA